MSHWSSTSNPVRLHNVGVQHIKFLILYLSFFLKTSLFSPQSLCICYFFRSFHGLSYYLGFSPRVTYLLRWAFPVYSVWNYHPQSLSVLLVHCIFLHIMYRQKLYVFVMFLPLEHVLCEGRDIICCPFYCYIT